MDEPRGIVRPRRHFRDESGLVSGDPGVSCRCEAHALGCTQLNRVRSSRQLGFDTTFENVNLGLTALADGDSELRPQIDETSSRAVDDEPARLLWNSSYDPAPLQVSRG